MKNSEESPVQRLFDSSFLFKREWALVVPGSSEGVYGFVSANYASGALQEWTTLPRRHDSVEFWGVLELGGASFQVNFLRVLFSTVEYYKAYYALFQ